MTEAQAKQYNKPWSYRELWVVYKAWQESDGWDKSVGETTPWVIDLASSGAINRTAGSISWRVSNFIAWDSGYPQKGADGANEGPRFNEFMKQVKAWELNLGCRLWWRLVCA